MVNIQGLGLYLRFRDVIQEDGDVVNENKDFDGGFDDNDDDDDEDGGDSNLTLFSL